jgi:3',5'-nucleoside bisphosphate phosphatase
LHIRADLHLHTQASDGDLSPEGIASYAQSAGLDAIALTDHDTIAGTRSSDEMARKYGLRIIPGVEISISYDPGTLHILGYFPSYPGEFEKILERLQLARVVRLPRIIERLNALGMDISCSDITDISKGGQIGRPHVAKALMKKGYVRDFEEAFARYLGKGKPAYVEKDRMCSGEAIDAIQAAGGLPVLAHPFTLGLGRDELKAFIQGLKEQGLQGIEIFYPDHTKPQKKLFRELAQELDLVPTGGTDFHSPLPGGIMPGKFGLDKKSYELFLEKLYRA